MSRHGTILSAAFATALAFLALPAHAEYCRTKACDNHLGYDDVWQTEPDPPCDTDINGCRLEGQTLYWPHNCLSFSVQQDGSKKQDISYDTTHEVIEQAFLTWMSADCGDGSTPSLRVDDLSPVVCDRPEYNSDQGNANVFMFRDNDWPHEDTFDTLALTTITYNRENAQIFDADVEINSFAAHFTTSDDLVQDDLLAVLTHETGHFLGLSHDSDERATMYRTYTPRTINQRYLFESDVRGMCDIYPPDLPISEDECVPRHGYMRTCATAESSGCALSHEPADGTRSWGLVAAVALGLGLRRRRPRAR